MSSSSHPATDLHDLYPVPEEHHVWPTVSRHPSSAILKPLSFPETPKEDISLFTDPSKDQPICCLICDQKFSSRAGDSLIRSKKEQTQKFIELSGVMERSSDMGAALKAEKTGVAESTGGRGEERARGKEESKVVQLHPKDEWLRHLLLEHKIVVHQVSEICSLKWYTSN